MGGDYEKCMHSCRQEAERNLSLGRAIYRAVLKWVMKMWTELD